MSRRDFTLNDIHLALDGELPADDRADFEHWLDAHADMKALKGRYERDRAVLLAALAVALLGALIEVVVLVELVFVMVTLYEAVSVSLVNGGPVFVTVSDGWKRLVLCESVPVMSLGKPAGW